MAMSALQSGWREKVRKCCPCCKKIEWKIHSPRWDLREICIIPSITSIKIYGPPSCVQLCISQVYLNLGGQIYPVRNDKRGCCIYGLLGGNILINRCVKESTESLGIPGLESNVRPIFSFVHKYATTTWTRFCLRLSVCTFGRKKKVCFERSIFLKASHDTMNIVFGFDRHFWRKASKRNESKKWNDQHLIDPSTAASCAHADLGFARPAFSSRDLTLQVSRVNVIPERLQLIRG